MIVYLYISLSKSQKTRGHFDASSQELKFLPFRNYWNILFYALFFVLKLFLVFRAFEQVHVYKILLGWFDGVQRGSGEFHWGFRLVSCGLAIARAACPAVIAPACKGNTCNGHIYWCPIVGEERTVSIGFPPTVTKQARTCVQVGCTWNYHTCNGNIAHVTFAIW